MYDTGLRVGELVQVDVEMLRKCNSTLYLPACIQKDYPDEDNTTDPATLSLSSDTTRTLSAYLPRPVVLDFARDDEQRNGNQHSDRSNETGVGIDAPRFVVKKRVTVPQASATDTGHPRLGNPR
jgi:hypothetical protein